MACASRRDFPSGVSTTLAALCFVSLASGIFINSAADLSSDDPSRNIAGSSWYVQVYIVAALTVLVLGSIWIAVRLARSGVYLREDHMLVRQVAKTHELTRDEVVDASVVDTANIFRISAAIGLTLTDNRSVKCMLYGKYLRRRNAQVVAEAVARWAGSSGKPGTGSRGKAQ